MLEAQDQIELTRRAESYLTHILGTATVIHGSTADRQLPFYISDQYGFYEGALAGRPCIFAVVRGDSIAPPHGLEKQLEIIQAHFPGRLLMLIFATLDSRTRQRLISRQIAFAVPYSQLYAPALAMDLRERTEASNPVPKHLSPSAQLLVLAHLLHQNVQDEQTSRLALRLHLTPMSMSRAFAEVDALNLVTINATGNERRLSFKLHGRELWEKTLPYLRSPVRKRRGLPELSQNFPALLAGEAALSRLTMLATPSAKSYAIAASQWKHLEREFKLYYSNSILDEDYVLETWSYDPSALSQSSVVDPFSLYLSVKDHADERVSIAADELLERSLQ